MKREPDGIAGRGLDSVTDACGNQNVVSRLQFYRLSHFKTKRRLATREQYPLWTVLFVPEPFRRSGAEGCNLLESKRRCAEQDRRLLPIGGRAGGREDISGLSDWVHCSISRGV